MGDGTKEGHLHDLHFLTNVNNGDGIDLRYNTKNITIENISGDTVDDLIALTCLPRKEPDYTGNVVFPMQPRPRDVVPVGEDIIENIDITNVEGETNAYIVRILASDRGQINNITLTNIRETAVDSRDAVAIITFGSDYGNIGTYIAGDIRNITINDVTNYRADWAIEFENSIVVDNVQADNIKYAAGTGGVLGMANQTNSSFTNIQQI